MSSDSILISKARLTLGLWRYADGTCLAVVNGELPGADTFHREMRCDSQEADEAFTWAEDFHSESKSFRSLMDCVAYDWCNSRLGLSL